LSAVLFFSAFRPDAMARDLIASVGIIPPHAEKGEDGQPQGGFVEVVKAIDRVYTDGHISIRLFPIARAISNVVNKHSDFFIPYIPNPKVRVETLPFAFTSEAIVKVSFVLYSRADRPALPMNKLGDYKVETLRGAAPHFSFPIGEIDSFRQGIQKVVAGRTDGFIAEQDATDKIIRENKIKNIRRTLYATWDSSIVIPKGPEGREIDRIVSDALLELKRTGELRKITDKIHRPFSDWQPYEMNW
ncbi:MAG: transporter substrate-binding domain-containing protein, partial [Deltaproteobacteria bacterium]|nr:transporter substrate-binding domain-containing protein [Deltaproteobacteria bacterium]